MDLNNGQVLKIVWDLTSDKIKLKKDLDWQEVLVGIYQDQVKALEGEIDKLKGQYDSLHRDYRDALVENEKLNDEMNAPKFTKTIKNCDEVEDLANYIEDRLARANEVRANKDVSL